MKFQPFRLESPLGGSIHGDLRIPATRVSDSAVVVVHGFKGFKDWGFFPFLCEKLVEAGHIVVSFDFSHNGVVAGEFRDLESFARNTITRELEELNHVLGSVSDGSVTGEPLPRLGLLGHSRGGADAVLAAAKNPLVRALVTWGALDHLDRWTDETVQVWRRDGVIHVVNQRTGQELPLSIELMEDVLSNRERLDPLRAAASIQVPWLVIHGRDDKTIPFVEGERLAQASSCASLRLLVEAGHTFGAVHPFQGTTPVLDRAIEFSVRHFGAHLRRVPQSEETPAEKASGVSSP